MPELPEMQALSERMGVFLAGCPLKGVSLLGFSSLRTYAPAPEDLVGQSIDTIFRRGKYVVVSFQGGLRIVVHLSQAGRVDFEEPGKNTRPRGAVARFTFDHGPTGGTRAILIREHGTQRKASWWVLAGNDEGPLEGLGPEPDTTAFADMIRSSDSNRRLHSDLRDQHVVAGIGRGWGDDILHRARLSPFGTLRSLGPEQREELIGATRDVLTEALELERTRAGGLSEAKLGGRFAVHGRFGSACPRAGCDDTLHRVSFESYEMAYCPTCQTHGKVLADRRMSRLLK